MSLENGAVNYYSFFFFFLKMGVLLKRQTANSGHEAARAVDKTSS